MDNPEKSATVSTYDTGRRQTKQKNKTQKTKKMSNSNMLDINIRKHTQNTISGG